MDSPVSSSVSSSAGWSFLSSSVLMFLGGSCLNLDGRTQVAYQYISLVGRLEFCLCLGCSLHPTDGLKVNLL